MSWHLEIKPVFLFPPSSTSWGYLKLLLKHVSSESLWQYMWSKNKMEATGNWKKPKRNIKILPRDMKQVRSTAMLHQADTTMICSELLLWQHWKNERISRGGDKLEVTSWSLPPQACGGGRASTLTGWPGAVDTLALAPSPPCNCGWRGCPPWWGRLEGGPGQ